PTPRTVLGVSSRQARSQRRLTVLRASGVALGTTLHIAAPSIRARPVNWMTRCMALPLNQSAVGMLACFNTRVPFAKPKCVFVFPISSSRIIIPLFTRSFFQRQVAAYDSLQMAMVGAQQQGSLFTERFGPAADLSIAGANDHILSNGGAMLLPLI